jgi:methionine sulfoxide reductase heme-binding subunit
LSAGVRKFLSTKWAKVLVLVLSLTPLLVIAWPFFRHDVIPNPVEFIQHATGDWTLRFLIFTLCVTPFRKIFNLPEFIRFRRMLGLFAFFYVCLHFTTYIWFDQSFDLSAIWKDVAKRRYITVGFLGFVCMIPLALSSTAASIRFLGGKRWQALHRLVYICAVAGVVHYYWLVKSAVIRPLAYGAIVAALLAWRIFDSAKRRKKTLPVPARATQLPTLSS